MSDGRKKLLIMTGIMIGLVVLIMIILLIATSSNGKSMTYSNIEQKLLKAAMSYYNENKALLPQNDGEKIMVDDATLSSTKHMKSMSDLTSKMKGVSCTGEVIVTKTDKTYRYAPLLNCGDSYKTYTLSSYIKEKEETVVTGSGLYDLNGEKVYRGDKVNNYVKLSGKMYRIVKISNDQVMLIYDEKWVASAWDDRYNVENNSSSGINDYSISRIKDKLNSFDQIKDTDNQLVARHDLYVGRRTVENDINDGSVEKEIVIANEKFGLLPLYDYINASIDENCTSSQSTSCINYNYLGEYNYSWWLITPAFRNTFRAYYVNAGGVIGITECEMEKGIRPVIYLSSDAIYNGGNGTFKNPYLVK